MNLTNKNKDRYLRAIKNGQIYRYVIKLTRVGVVEFFSQKFGSSKEVEKDYPMTGSWKIITLEFKFQPAVAALS